MAKRQDFIGELTAELRVGRPAWKVIRPHVTRYVLIGDVEFFDWLEIKKLIQRTARAEPPSSEARIT